MNPHACIVNEYDASFLHRDGWTTLASEREFNYLPGPKATPEQRFALSAYALAGLTEYWRAYRDYAGVMYSPIRRRLPKGVTCDNFRDVKRLVLDPHLRGLRRRGIQAAGGLRQFLAVGFARRRQADYRVMMVNDTHERARGRLVLSWDSATGDRGRASRTSVRHSRSRASELRHRVDHSGQGGTSPTQSEAFWDGKVLEPDGLAAQRRGELRGPFG